MTKTEFLDTLRRRLGGMPAAEIDDVIADYRTHFDDGMAAGRSEAEIAAALGDPMRLARELRAESGFKRWEAARTPSNFIAALFGFLALVAVDFILLLPVLCGLLVFTLIAAIVAFGLCIGGIVVILREFGPGLLSHESLSEMFTGIALLGFGVGGSALLLWLCDAVVKLLAKYARFHYALLENAR